MPPRGACKRDPTPVRTTAVFDPVHHEQGTGWPHIAGAMCSAWLAHEGLLDQAKSPSSRYRIPPWISGMSATRCPTYGAFFEKIDAIPRRARRAPLRCPMPQRVSQVLLVSGWESATDPVRLSIVFGRPPAPESDPATDIEIGSTASPRALLDPGDRAGDARAGACTPPLAAAGHRVIFA